MQQGSDEWQLAHAGILSGRHMDTIMKGGMRAWCTLLDRKKAEIEDPTILLNDEINAAAINHGNKYEDEAIDHYELIYDVDVERPSLMMHPEVKFLGCSPDFWLPKPKIVGEVKCPHNPANHMLNVVHGAGVMTYRPQIMLEVECTKAEEAHFVSYDPRNPDPAMQFIRICVERDDDYIDHMLTRCHEFWHYLTTDTRPQAPSYSCNDGIPDIF